METKQKILIVDDSAMNREILSEVLGDTYEYQFACNGMQALEILSQSLDVDLVLLDIHMPQMDGFGVLNIMKQRQWIDEVPVIVISAEEDIGFIQKAYDLGAVDYINRPFNLSIVQRRVHNTLLLYAQQKRLVQLVEDQVYEREKDNSAMVSMLGHVIETRSHETGAHILHVRLLTDVLLRHLTQITDRYTFTESDISRIVSLSALHDIGKIGIPEEILNKPGKLDDREWEIMKAHPVIGDVLLQDIPDAEGNPFLTTAREICRHHHERWDGKGYPDGLRGDDIPISAQVVALADVFDALTSDRCYRKALPFETAMEMIHAGQCGAFNPLLMQCLDASRDELYACLKDSGKTFDVQSEAKHLAIEVLQNRELPQDDRGLHILALEKARSEFFAQECGGIQFEYDRFLRKVVYTDWNAEPQNRVRVLYLNDGDDLHLLSDADQARFRNLIASATQEKPYVEMQALLNVRGEMRWHRLRARTLWTRKSPECAGVIGQFTDIQDAVSEQGVMRLTGEDADAYRLLQGLHKIFEVVQLVDPRDCRILRLSENGRLVDTGRRCYEIWGRSHACENCSSARAVEVKSWTSKLEIKGTELYFVLSKYLAVGDQHCVLEIASRIDDALVTDSQNQLPERAGMLLLNFYRDALTQAYSRLYLHNFSSRFETADGVAMLDVDQFKQINDVFGHTIGDEALKSVVSTVLSCIRSTDTLIRYGGDEFLLIFNSIDEGVFYRRLEQIQAAVSRTLLPEHPDVHLSISFGGVYRVRPLKEAIRQADLKMYANKALQSARNMEKGEEV